MRWKAHPLLVSSSVNGETLANKGPKDKGKEEEYNEEQTIMNSERETKETPGLDQDKWSIRRSKSKKVYTIDSGDEDKSETDVDTNSGEEEELVVQTKFIPADHGIHVAYDRDFSLKQTTIEGTFILIICV